MRRASVDTGVAVDAFALVDDRERLSHGDRALRAEPYAFLTADAADITVLSRSGTRPLILATYSNCCSDWHQFDELFRTDFDTLSTSVALGTVDLADPVDDLDRTKSTCCYTISEAEAAEGTGVRSAEETGSRVTAAGA